MKKLQFIVLMIVSLFFINNSFAAWVITEGDSVFIEDRTGERWDVTQAKELGFIPQRFQYGIGKNAFTPLQDKDFSDEKVSSFFNTRVIGITVGNKAQAFSVQKMKHHEIANTTIGGDAIIAGY